MSTSYRALTRTYRPQTFDDIVSQEHVSNTLKNAIAKDRLSHAYLFCGPRGVGKTTMARVLARTINNVGLDVDGENLNNTLNIIEIDAASNNSVDDVRSLRERVRIPPQSGRFKIYIIDEVHMLSKQAFNALLKTLEEPPAHVIFIFATTEPHRILPTILSRCQRFDFRRITVDEIVNRLSSIAEKEKIQIDPESLHVIAKKADGALRDALGILDQAIAFCGTAITYDDLHRALNIVSSERMFELTDALHRNDTRAGMALLHHLLHVGNDIQEFLGALTEHLRNMYLARDSQNFYLLEATQETKERFQKMAGLFSEDDLMRMMHTVHEAEFSIRNAQQPRIHLEITLLKLFHMTRTEGFEQLLIKLGELEQKLVSGNSGAVDGKHGAPSGSSEPQSAKTGSPSHNPGKLTENPGTADSDTMAEASSGTRLPFPGKPEQKSDAISVNSSRQVEEEPGIFGTPTLKRQRNQLIAVALPGKSRQNEEEQQVNGNLALSPVQKAEKAINNNKSETSRKQEDETKLIRSGILAPGDNAKLGKIHQNTVAETGDSPANPKNPVPKKPESLNEVMESWPEFLNLFQASFNSWLYFSILKTRPVDYKDDIITLECSDSFTSDIVHEQHRNLCNVVKEHFGFVLRFSSRLVEQKNRTDTVHDPYEFFSKLLKNDDKLKKIVSLFGAELEY